MADMRKLIEIASSSPKLDESVLATAGLAAGVLGASLGAQRLFKGHDASVKFRQRETVVLYEKGWTLDQLVKRYWRHVRAESPKSEELKQRLRTWIVRQGRSLRPEDEPTDWQQ